MAFYMWPTYHVYVKHSWITYMFVKNRTEKII